MNATESWSVDNFWWVSKQVKRYRWMFMYIYKYIVVRQAGLFLSVLVVIKLGCARYYIKGKFVQTPQACVRMWIFLLGKVYISRCSILLFCLFIVSFILFLTISYSVTMLENNWMWNKTNQRSDKFNSSKLINILLTLTVVRFVIRRWDYIKQNIIFYRMLCVNCTCVYVGHRILLIYLCIWVCTGIGIKLPLVIYTLPTFPATN